MSKLVESILKAGRGAGKEEQLAELLQGKIAGGTWEVGNRLPSERALAVEFSVSRNTLRGALRRLEAKDLLISRHGSGYYVKSTCLPDSPDTAAQVKETYERIMARLEAAYLFLPGVVSIAAVNISDEYLSALEQCTVDLSRAIFNENIKAFKKQARYFFQVIAASTGNPVIEEVVSAFCASSSLMFPGFFSFGEIQQKKLFADYVLIFNALKQHDVDEAVNAVRKKVINTCTAFSELKGVRLPRSIETARNSMVA